MPSEDESEPIRVLLADDHAIVRSGVRALLESQGWVDVVGEAADGIEAVSMVKTLQPRVVVMDINMPKINGIEATRLIRKSQPTVGVVGLTMYDEDVYFYEMLKAGACGYVLKDAPAAELFSAVRAAARGETYLSPAVATMLARERLGDSSHAWSRSLDGLTRREHEVLTLVAEGNSNKEIAEQLGITVRTIETHRTNAMNKLNLHDRTEIVKFAISRGYISLDAEDEISSR